MAADLESDVLWLADRDRNRGGNQLCVAPLQVWGPLRDKLLTDKTVVFTSATLMLGGDFSSVATSIGLKPSERVDHSIEGVPTDGAGETMPWRGIDVGSPFDYAKQGILYVARHLPPPGRDGLGEKQVDEIVDLVDAANGRTLGLFSSRRGAEAAAEAVRERLPHLTILAQGEAQLPELARLFVEDPHACLFGTLSLWQGLDVPGDTCQLVLIDRVPFPRPDDPLMSARQRAADKAGGNGFMAVAATHAALLLAQGAGRLIRTTDDRGVVAVLDPRLVTARYGSFLRASLPPMWPTTDRRRGAQGAGSSLRLSTPCRKPRRVEGVGAFVTLRLSGGRDGVTVPHAHRGCRPGSCQGEPTQGSDPEFRPGRLPVVGRGRRRLLGGHAGVVVGEDSSAEVGIMCHERVGRPREREARETCHECGRGDASDSGRHGASGGRDGAATPHPCGGGDTGAGEDEAAQGSEADLAPVAVVTGVGGGRLLLDGVAGVRVDGVDGACRCCEGHAGDAGHENTGGEAGERAAVHEGSPVWVGRWCELLRPWP